MATQGKQVVTKRHGDPRRAQCVCLRRDEVARLAKDLGGQLSCSRVRRQAVANCPSCHPHGYESMLSGPFEYPEKESIRVLHLPLGISLGPKSPGYSRLNKKK